MGNIQQKKDRVQVTGRFKRGKLNVEFKIFFMNSKKNDLKDVTLADARKRIRENWEKGGNIIWFVKGTDENGEEMDAQSGGNHTTFSLKSNYGDEKTNVWFKAILEFLGSAWAADIKDKPHTGFQLHKIF